MLLSRINIFTKSDGVDDFDNNYVTHMSRNLGSLRITATRCSGEFILFKL
jgi:hypothetical protein